jgi:uncharacterized SAM-binding protein YcdF (DUF218 family)
MTLLKAIGPPGSVRFLLLGVTIGLVISYLWPKRRRLGRAWLMAVVGGYALLSWPPVAQTILAGLQAAVPTAIERLGPLDVLVVFDGDNRQGRVRAVELVIADASPAAVHVIGSPLILNVMSDGLLDRIRHHPATNTREQVEWLQQLAERSPPTRMGVVVSRIQAPRASALIAKAVPGVRVIASPLDAELPKTWLRRMLPSYAALCVSRDALYEYAALAYYRWRGWT